MTISMLPFIDGHLSNPLHLWCLKPWKKEKIKKSEKEFREMEAVVWHVLCTLQKLGSSHDWSVMICWSCG